MNKQQFNKGNWYAILIGVSSFDNSRKIDGALTTLHEIPNIKINLKLLSESLQNNELIGISQENIFIFSEEDNLVATKILSKIEEISKGLPSDSNLIIYYAGHGVRSKHGDYFLASSESTIKHILSSGISTNILTNIIRENSSRINQYIILDCCYSGSFLGYQSDLTSEMNVLMDKMKSNRTFIITASHKQEAALYDKDDAFVPTYFTQEMLRVINNGVEGVEQFLTWEDIFIQTRENLQKAGWPEPYYSSFGDANKEPIAVNKLYKLNNEEVQARNYFLKGDYENAKKLYLKVSKENPKNIEAKNKLSKIEFINLINKALEYKTEGKYDKALEYYRNAYYLDPTQARLRDEICDSVFKLYKEERNGYKRDKKGRIIIGGLLWFSVYSILLISIFFNVSILYTYFFNELAFTYYFNTPKSNILFWIIYVISSVLLISNVSIFKPHEPKEGDKDNNENIIILTILECGIISFWLNYKNISSELVKANLYIQDYQLFFILLFYFTTNLLYLKYSERAIKTFNSWNI